MYLRHFGGRFSEDCGWEGGEKRSIGVLVGVNVFMQGLGGMLEMDVTDADVLRTDWTKSRPFEGFFSGVCVFLSW